LENLSNKHHINESGGAALAEKVGMHHVGDACGKAGKEKLSKKHSIAS
jgi:hypothetical protein